MKMIKIHFFVALILTTFVSTQSHAGINEFLEKKDQIIKKAAAEIANTDVTISANLLDLDLINGVNVGLKARYEVEPSYLDQYYTRVDKYTVKGNINVGEVVKNFTDLPFSFSVNRENSFYFIRQFPSKKEALLSLPYSPKRLPINAERALKNLDVGDFVSMPGNISLAVEATASTSYVAPVMVNGTGKIYWIVSGEFTIQIFKLDENHVRLKMISKRAYTKGANAGVGLSFDVFGVKVVDRQLERLVEKDFVNMGYEQNPGEQFIVDYVFDLSNIEAKEAYDQILSSTVKFKDIDVLNKLKGGANLKDKLISSFENAERLFNLDKSRVPKERRVSRIFKGFNDYTGYTHKLKFAFLVTRFQRDLACTENKLTFMDKNDNNMEYFYPTCSRYNETKIGKWIFDLKDEEFLNNFGLIPKVNHDEAKNKDPDFGLNYERRDKSFNPAEQRLVQRFLMGQMPKAIGESINLGEWKQNKTKKDSKITFQLTLKSQGFNYLRHYSEEDLVTRLKAYYKERKALAPVTKTEAFLLKIKNFLNRYLNIGDTKEEKVKKIASSLYHIIKNEEQNSSNMLSKLVLLSRDDLFEKVGVGFLVSLLPEQQLEELIYVTLNVKAKDAEELNFEYGRSNYRSLYKEISKIQTRIAAQTYDLRVTDADHESEDAVITEEATRVDPVAEVPFEDNFPYNEAI